MSSLWLAEEDKEKLTETLTDAKECLNYGIGIAGSVAQRALSRELSESLRSQPLHDVDLLLLGTITGSPELPKLREKFKVFEVVNSEGWYYGMKHRRTGMSVDLFTPRRGQIMKQILINGDAYQATSIESQILYLAHDILRRKRGGYPIRRKWIEKIEGLTKLPTTDQQAIQEEYVNNLEYFDLVLPSYHKPIKSADDYIRLATSQRATPWIKEKIFLIRWFLFRRTTKIKE